jgi:hypothetical protein
MRKKRMRVSCPNCLSNKIKKIYTYLKNDIYEEKLKIFYKKKSIDNRKWFVCKNCDFYFSSYAILSKDIMSKIYKNIYRKIESNNISRYEKLLKLPLALSMNKQRVNFIKKNLNKFYNKKIINFKSGLHLDIGGGSGIFSIQFRDKKWESDVMDLPMQNLFSKKYKLKYYSENIIKLKKNITKKKYNLITIIDTLEHIKDFKKFLIKIKNILLDKEGLIFIDCPGNYNFGRKKITHDIFNSCHYNMWCANSFSNLASQLDFEVLNFSISSEEKDFYSFKCFLVNKKKINVNKYLNFSLESNKSKSLKYLNYRSI